MNGFREKLGDHVACSSSFPHHVTDSSSSKREAMEAQIAALRAAYEAQASELEAAIEEGHRTETTLDRQRTALAVVREGRGITGNSSSHKRKGADHGQTDKGSRQGNGHKERTRTEAR